MLIFVSKRFRIFTILTIESKHVLSLHPFCCDANHKGENRLCRAASVSSKSDLSKKLSHEADM